MKAGILFTLTWVKGGGGEMQANGNGNGWRNWILTVLLSVLVMLALFGTAQIQSKADKEELKCTEQRLKERDQELKTEFTEQMKINAAWMKSLSEKIDKTSETINQIKGKVEK